MDCNSDIFKVLQDWFYTCNTKEEVKDLVMTLNDNIELISDCRLSEVQ